MLNSSTPPNCCIADLTAEPISPSYANLLACSKLIFFPNNAPNSSSEVKEFSISNKPSVTFVKDDISKPSFLAAIAAWIIFFPPSLPYSANFSVFAAKSPATSAGITPAAFDASWTNWAISAPACAVPSPNLANPPINFAVSPPLRFKLTASKLALSCAPKVACSTPPNSVDNPFATAWASSNTNPNAVALRAISLKKYPVSLAVADILSIANPAPIRAVPKNPIGPDVSVENVSNTPPTTFWIFCCTDNNPSAASFCCCVRLLIDSACWVCWFKLSTIDCCEWWTLPIFAISASISIM